MLASESERVESSRAATDHFPCGNKFNKRKKVFPSTFQCVSSFPAFSFGCDIHTNELLLYFTFTCSFRKKKNVNFSSHKCHLFPFYFVRKWTQNFQFEEENDVTQQQLLWMIFASLLFIWYSDGKLIRWINLINMTFIASNCFLEIIKMRHWSSVNKNSLKIMLRLSWIGLKHCNTSWFLIEFFLEINYLMKIAQIFLKTERLLL